MYEEKCYTYQNDTYLRWHQWICKDGHMVPKESVTPLAQTILTNAAGVTHAFQPSPSVAEGGVVPVWVAVEGKCYFKTRVGVLSSPSSHMWDYSPIWHLLPLFTSPLVHSVVRIILVSVVFSLGSDEAMWFVMANACLFFIKIMCSMQFTRSLQYWITTF